MARTATVSPIRPVRLQADAWHGFTSFASPHLNDATYEAECLAGRCFSRPGDADMLRRATGGAEMNWTTDPPTQPGSYWFKREPNSREILVDVRMTDGQLTVLWPQIDQPVAKLNAQWRGPIPPSSGPGSR